MHNTFDIATLEHTQLFHQDLCVSIQGICEVLSLSEFFINGHLTQWPQSDNMQYNVTYSQSSREYSFCFINITENITISEFCYQHHSASCSLCSTDTGELYFLSYSSIFVIAPAEGIEKLICIGMPLILTFKLIQDLQILLNQQLALFHHHMVLLYHWGFIVNIIIIIIIIAKIYPASINYHEAEISKPLNDKLASRIRAHSVTHTVMSEDQLLESDSTNKIVLFGKNWQPHYYTKRILLSSYHKINAGAIAIGAAGILVGMILVLVIPIGLWYHKEKRNEMGKSQQTA